MIQVAVPGGYRPVSGIVTNVFAAHNPVCFTIDRYDHFFNSTADSSGNTQIDIDTGYGLVNPIPAYGDKLLFVGATESGVYNVTFASSTIIVIDKPFTINENGYVNLIQTRKGYYMRCEAFVWNGTSYDTIGASRHHPNAAGQTIIDVSNYFRKVVHMRDLVYYPTPESFEDANLAKQIRFEFSEIFVGNTPAVDYTFLCACINAALPAHHKELTPGIINQGSSMSEFYTEPSGDDPALFLSSVRKLRYFEGLPFDVGYFYSVNLVTIASTFKRQESYYNKSGVNISNAFFNIAFGGIGAGLHNKVHRTGLATTQFAPTPYPANYDLMRIKLVADSITITEEMEIRIEHCISSTPVMLKAFDRFGCWRYFCFRGKQLRGINAQSIGTFSKWYSNISTQDADIEFIGKDVTPELKLGADMLDIYDMQIIEVILGSAKVYMLTNPLTWLSDTGDGSQQGDIWETVRVKPGTYQTLQTNHVYNSIEFSIELLQVNTPTQ